MQGKIQTNTISQGKTMLYCPRCNREYNEGVQRFCIHDGGRLIPKGGAPKPASGGVFSSLVSKASTPDESDEILSLPKFVPVVKPGDNPRENPPAPQFIRDAEPSMTRDPFSEDKPAGKQVNIGDLPSFQAPLGDRKRNPTGRLALSWENPNVLLGHVVRGRYFIEQRAGIDDVCITYLAQDRAANNKRIIFKVLSLGSDYIQNSTEERIALSHLNHPHIVKILDSGEMPEGMPFAAFEYIEGSSLRELLDSGDPIPAADTARIVKQISEALSGAQQNGVLHYDVRPQKVILKPEPDGTQIAKVTDFALAKGYKAPSVRKLKDVAYQSPEQLQGREIRPSSESYSLAVMAYEMLIGRLPFNFESMRELLDAQKRGLTSKPRMVIPQLPAAVDDIFTRALSYDPDARYQKARDFGEALYNALNSAGYAADQKVDQKAAAEMPADDILMLDDRTTETVTAPVVLNNTAKYAGAKEDILDLGDKTASAVSAVSAAATAPSVSSGAVTPVQSTPDRAWEKHAQPSGGLSKWAVATIGLLGLILIGGAIFFGYNYFNNPGAESQQASTDGNTQADPQAGNQTGNQTGNQAGPTQPGAVIEDNPPPRIITPPENSTRFQNIKEGLSPILLRNFRGFSLYYPNSWIKSQSEANFLDITKNAEDGTLIERMLVSWYESKGIFSADEASFPKMAEDLNKKRAQSIEGYKAVSQGPIVFNNNRQAYELKFQGEGKDSNKQTAYIWGRTIFLPPGVYGKRNGLVITMLTTSKSTDVKGVDDVGTKGDLKDILYSLEPDPLDNLH
jgi:serine/threonine protein kinase